MELFKGLQAKFQIFDIRQVPRESNTQADALACPGAVFKHLNLSNIPIIHVFKSSIKKHDDLKYVMILEGMTRSTTSWTRQRQDYLTSNIQPDDKNEAKSIRMKACEYIMVDGELFKKSITGLLQRCLEVEEAQHVPKELHESDCGNHSGGLRLSYKALKMRYF